MLLNPDSDESFLRDVQWLRAIGNGSREPVNDLVFANYHHYDKRVTALQYAIIDGEYENTFRTLLSMVPIVNLDRQDSDRQTALHWAGARMDREEYAQMLIDAGADLEITDAWGRTPLLVAVVHKNAPCVRVMLAALVTAGKSVDQYHYDGRSALHVACKKNAGLPIVKELVQCGADLFAQTRPSQMTPFDFAQRSVETAVRDALKDPSPHWPYEVQKKRAQEAIDNSKGVVNYMILQYANRVYETHGDGSIHAVLEEAAFQGNRVVLPLGSLQGGHFGVLLQHLAAHSKNTVAALNNATGEIPLFTAIRMKAPLDAINFLLRQHPKDIQALKSFLAASTGKRKRSS